MTHTNETLILELVETVDEQHEMIKFLLEQIPKSKHTPEINAAIERISAKIKHVKDSRIAAILVRQNPKWVRGH